MLVITVPATKSVEYFDESKQEFVTKPGTKEQTLQLEHSLVSLSKWESKWCRPFLSSPPATVEETIDYIKFKESNKDEEYMELLCSNL